MMRKRLLTAVVALTCSSLAQTPLEGDARTQWFRDAKFGMFIHWGVYSVIGRHEWSRHLLQIPQAQYDTFARQFNPVNFNADSWVDLAQNAGARYMVITSKHHDGFSIWRSKVSDYDMEITRYPGDPLKQLADACQRKGMRLGFYHSIMDWHHPDYTPKRTWEVANPTQGGNLDRFIRGFLMPQLQELLTGYGNVAVVWFDGEWEHKPSEFHADEIYDFIRKLQPNALINDRLYNREPGNRADFGTPEQFVPATGIRDPSGKPRLWESCVTINEDSWGYNKYETRFKTSRDLIRMLIEVVSKGGNLLLNVGPRPDGTIQPEFVARLNAIGSWMKINSDSIYGTTASPFGRLPFFGRATQKGNKLYLHVFQWPADGALRVPGLSNQVLSARLLAAPDRRITSRRDGSDLIVGLPGEAPDEVASVVELTLDGPAKVSPYSVKPDASGVITLGVESSEIQTRFGQVVKKENILGHVYMTQWERASDVPAWNLSVPKAGRYAVELSYAMPDRAKGTGFTVVAGKCQFEVEARGSVSDGCTDKRELQAQAAETGGQQVFKTFPIGELDLQAGAQQLLVTANLPAGQQGVNLERVRLIPR